MVCLLGTEETGRADLRCRVWRAFSGNDGFIAWDAVVLGMRVLRIAIGAAPGIKQDKLRRIIGNTANRMRHDRVSHVVFAKNFPYRSGILREGFDEIERSLLIEKLAGRIASQLSGEGKSAALFAGRLTIGALRTLSELCASFRFLMVLTETRTGRDFDALRRQTGVSIIERPTARQLTSADVAIFYGAPNRPVVLPAGCVALGIGSSALTGVLYNRAVSGLTLGLSGGKDGDVPENFFQEDLFAAALTAGTLKPEDIAIMEIALSDGSRLRRDS